MRAFCMGLLLACLGIGHPYGSPLLAPSPLGPGAWWVADRGGDRLWLLDADLLPVAAFPACSPVALAPDTRASGSRGVWVVEALEHDPRGRHRLRWFDGGGAAPLALALPPILGMVSGPEGPLLLARDGRLLALRGGELVPLGRFDDPRALAGDGSSLWVAAGERLIELDPVSGVGREERAVAGGVRGICPGPKGAWWLDGQGSLHSPEGSCRPIPWEEGALGAGWLFDQGGNRLEPLSHAIPTAPMGPRSLPRDVAGIESAASNPQGETLIVTAESVHLIDGRGGLLVSQGGFGYAVSAAPAGGVEPQ